MIADRASHQTLAAKQIPKLKYAPKTRPYFAVAAARIKEGVLYVNIPPKVDNLEKYRGMFFLES